MRMRIPLLAFSLVICLLLSCRLNYAKSTTIATKTLKKHIQSEVDELESSPTSSSDISEVSFSNEESQDAEAVDQSIPTQTFVPTGKLKKSQPSQVIEENNIHQSADEDSQDTMISDESIPSPTTSLKQTKVTPFGQTINVPIKHQVPHEKTGATPNTDMKGHPNHSTSKTPTHEPTSLEAAEQSLSTAVIPPPSGQDTPRYNFIVNGDFEASACPK
jgi:hypothetical protein